MTPAPLSLRRRFLLATGALFVSQLVTSGLALGSWRTALWSVDRQQALAETRVEVAGLGSAVREQYVHQAHTYIEGGPGHLHHGGEAATAVHDRLDHLDRIGVPEDDRALLATVRRNQAALESWFDERVAPLAEVGALDRVQAATLHAETERLTAETTASVDALLAHLDAASAAEQVRSGRVTTLAVAATLGVAAFGLVVVLFIGRSLANAVLAPVEAIRAAASAWRPGAPTHDADELGELAGAFEAIVAKLGESEAQRLDSARLVALGEMSAVVAHELMNPLAVILGHLPRLEGDGVPVVRAEAEHARRIITGLLGFARPIEQEATQVDVVNAVTEAIDRSVFAADARGITVKLVESMPATLLASPSGVRQILDNLLSNAIEACPDDVVIEVAMCGSPRRVEVRDRGEGIAPAVRKRMYEPFVTGKARGTGLGLAVCQRIARSCGTVIEHTDRPGGGTVATWTLEKSRG